MIRQWEPQTSIGQDMDRLDCRVLLVDDYPAYRLLLKRILEEAGVCVRTAEHGGVGVSLVYAAEGTDESYDAVITDLDMPVVGGHGMLKTLRQLGYDGPVIAVSSHDRQDMAARCLEQGFAGYMEKTNAGEQLIPALRRVLEAHRQPRDECHSIKSA